MKRPNPSKDKGSHHGPAIHCAYDKVVPIEELTAHPQNPNTHPERQIRLYARIIRANGWRRPITVSKRSGFVVKGHGGLLAAKKLRLRLVPVDFQAYASAEEELADMIADNKLAEQAQMDPEKLEALLQEFDEKNFDRERAGVLDAAEKTAREAEELSASWQILIECADEEEQARLLRRFAREKLNCKALTA